MAAQLHYEQDGGTKLQRKSKENDESATRSYRASPRFRMPTLSLELDTGRLQLHTCNLFLGRRDVLQLRQVLILT